jgi:hypothetical protein
VFATCQATRLGFGKSPSSRRPGNVHCAIRPGAGEEIATSVQEPPSIELHGVAGDRSTPDFREERQTRILAAGDLLNRKAGRLGFQDQERVGARPRSGGGAVGENARRLQGEGVGSGRVKPQFICNMAPGHDLVDVGRGDAVPGVEERRRFAKAIHEKQGKISGTAHGLQFQPEPVVLEGAGFDGLRAHAQIEKPFTMGLGQNPDGLSLPAPGSRNQPPPAPEPGLPDSRRAPPPRA